MGKQRGTDGLYTWTKRRVSRGTARCPMGQRQTRSVGGLAGSWKERPFHRDGYYFINIDLLKQISRKLRNQIKMRIKNKCFFYNLSNYKINVDEEFLKFVLYLYLQNC
jgi:hypothetical protein